MVDNYLTSCCRDMGVTMMTTAYSPIFNESLDFSCVIFDPTGNMLAQAEFCPSQIGTIKFTVEWTIEELGLDAFEEGDVVLHNDPYRGSGHVPEHMLLKPVFWEGKIVAFVANVAHMSEVGAKTPGGLSGDATEIYQEGLLLPPVKIKRRGEDVDDVWKIILSNHRTPRVTLGDFRAMMGSLDLAERRIHKLIADYGLDFFLGDVGRADGDRRAADARRDRGDPRRRRTPSRTRSRTTASPTATTRSSSRLTIDGGEVIADFTGSAPQAVGPVNAIYAVTASAIYNAFLHLTDPTIPRNEGCYRPFTIIAPPGTIVNCSFPAPVAGGNTETSPRITDMVFGALQDAIPDRVAASCGGTSSPFLFGGTDPRTGRAVRPLPLRGRRLGRAQGPRRQQHGRHDQRQLPQHARRGLRDALPGVPDRVVPARRPTRAARASSAAASAASAIFTVTVPEVTVSALLNRMKTEPWGVLGGGEGRRRRALGAPAPAARSGARSSRSSGRCRRRSSRASRCAPATR